MNGMVASMRVMLWAACCGAALAAAPVGARASAEAGALRLVVVPDRTYVEPCFEQIGLNDRVSLHFVLINDGPDAVELDSIRFSFQGEEGCAHEVTLSREALMQRLKECAPAVFVRPEAGERWKLTTESRLPPGGLAALIGNRFDLPAAMGVKAATIEVTARDEGGGDRSISATVELRRYETSTRFQFPYEGVWVVTNAHGPGMGHPIDSFAYDFAKVRGIGLHDGDGRKLEQWWGYGAPVLAAADGVVVEANQAAGLPERAPFQPYPSARELGLAEEVVLTNTMVTVEADAVHYRPGNISWQALSVEDRARINGAYVIVRHGEEEFSFYAHLQPGSLTVRPGDRVEAGEPIGKCGASGNANGAGLHFQVLYQPDPNAGLPVEFTPTEAPELHLRLQTLGAYEN